MAYVHTGFWQPMDTLRDKQPARGAVAVGACAVEALVSEALRRRLLARQARPGHRPHRVQGRVAGALAAIGSAPRSPGSRWPPTSRASTAWPVSRRCVASRIVDLRDAAATAAAVRAARPQIVLHLAAQALVRASYREPLATFATNTMGTAHVLDALRGLDDVCVAVVVTTDKVYRNNEWAYPYREDDALGGHDPYSASKAAAELVAASYRSAFLEAQQVAVATARAGNVIGGGDWSDDRLIPDAVRAWQSGSSLTIRRPQAIRPWQHVLDPLAGYLRLAERLWHAPNLRRRLQLRSAYRRGGDRRHRRRPGAHRVRRRPMAGRGGRRARTRPVGSRSRSRGHASVLGVAPRWALPEAVRRTMLWYRRLADGAAARALCEADIADHEAAGAGADRGTDSGRAP